MKTVYILGWRMSTCLAIVNGPGSSDAPRLQRDGAIRDGERRRREVKIIYFSQQLNRALTIARMLRGTH